jgi:hypothetical protein
MSYDNHTLFNLYEIVASNKIPISSTFSKATLISSIEEASITIAPKEKKEDIDWFTSVSPNGPIICIDIDDEFYIFKGDIIATNDDRYIIKGICNEAVLLKNADTEEYTELEIEDFIDFFNNDHIVYQYSLYTDCRFQ